MSIKQTNSSLIRDILVLNHFMSLCAPYSPYPIKCPIPFIKSYDNIQYHTRQKYVLYKVEQYSKISNSGQDNTIVDRIAATRKDVREGRKGAIGTMYVLLGC